MYIHSALTKDETLIIDGDLVVGKHIMNCNFLGQILIHKQEICRNKGQGSR
jgi:hypothetical protein